MNTGQIGIFGMLLIGMIGCGVESPKSSADKSAKTTSTQSSGGAVDVCRCMSEPGNSAFSKANEKACDKAISKKLEVPDWQKANLNDAAFNKKWKNLEKECGSTTSECMAREQKARGCTAKNIKDPNWDSQGCTQALVGALKACK